MTIGLAIAAYILFVLWICQLMRSRDMEWRNDELARCLRELKARVGDGTGK